MVNVNQIDDLMVIGMTTMMLVIVLVLHYYQCYYDAFVVYLWVSWDPVLFMRKEENELTRGAMAIEGM
jgi:hypothetical protein